MFHSLDFHYFLVYDKIKLFRVLINFWILLREFVLISDSVKREALASLGMKRQVLTILYSSTRLIFQSPLNCETFPLRLCTQSLTRKLIDTGIQRESISRMLSRLLLGRGEKFRLNFITYAAMLTNNRS